MLHAADPVNPVVNRFTKLLTPIVDELKPVIGRLNVEAELLRFSGRKSIMWRDAAIDLSGSAGFFRLGATVCKRLLASAAMRGAALPRLQDGPEVFAFPKGGW